jgi:putative transposase
MSQAYKIHKQETAYFMTLQVVSWVDIFTRKRYKDIVVDAMNYAINNKGLTIYSYVIMSNHE